MLRDLEREPGTIGPEVIPQNGLADEESLEAGISGVDHVSHSTASLLRVRRPTAGARRSCCSAGCRAI